MARGFSVDILAQLIRYSPGSFLSREILSRLLFWRDFIGEDDETYSKFIKRNCILIGFDIDRHIVPRMNVLKECGLSNRDIAAMLWSGHSFMNRSIGSLRRIIALIENLGLLRGSCMFLAGLRALSSYNIDTIRRTREFFKTEYAWSEKDLCIALNKFPSILQYSEEKV